MIIDYAGVSGSSVAYYAAREAAKHDKILILVSSEAAALRLREDLSFFVSHDIFVVPEEEDIRIIYEARDTSKLIGRIRAENALLSDGRVIVISPVSSALRDIPLPDYFRSRCRRLTVGEMLDPGVLKSELIKAGYIHTEVAESHGEFSSRGDIIDIHTASLDDPVRIEFFGDEIDSIRSYDRDSQRSIENLESVLIVPAALFIPDDDQIASAAERIGTEVSAAAAEVVREKMNSQIYADLIEYFDVETCKLWDYFDGTTALQDPVRIYEAVPDSHDKSELFGLYHRDTVLFTPFPEMIEGVERMDELINVKSRQIAPFNGQMKLLEKEVRDLCKAGYQVAIVSHDNERLKRLREYLDDAGLIGRVSYERGSLGSGIIIDDDKKCYITERDIFPGSKKQNIKRKSRPAGRIDFSDLNKGDYVVHEDHGIGVYEGIVTMEADGEIRDYLKIRYAGTDVLYIPTEQLDIIQKYIGNQGKAPSLSRLSGTSWNTTRKKARRAIMEIAEDLVRLYAERENTKGHAFGPDTVWQTEFEDDFPYTETDDQLQAIREIKEDMEQPVPMDRLLCGDVGYGKTEVAARAIFKCISEGKQAVMLAPTTLLANQHYHTLKERMANFPFEVEMLSRFRTDAEQTEIIQKVKNGTVDLLIGTHRVLSEDVKFRDLGLLVIDEEQRFGVKHKERIKMLRKDVDVLTLSATPIPRTLNMSLTGIKNISMIEEPPEDRYPVQTYVTPEDEALLQSVIRRELSRGGQVFVVNNRINGIHEIAGALNELVPEARIAVGHGRMNEVALEKIMLDFIEGRTDILVATTIIENGIDIPNANTMIVLNSDMLGLAQLYQLRGRVGRSDKIAYAYLTYKQNKVMTELAYKRLTAIRDFTEFGAGFKLAMRDLELRGAGNILGEAQHGHIEGIGYELYCKEIDRAVRTLMGEHVTETLSDITVEVDIPARIPEQYISNETLKLQAYKRIARIGSEEEALDVINEMIDRYGDMPDMTLNLIKVAEIRSHAERVGVSGIKQSGRAINITLREDSRVNAYVLVMTKDEIGDKLTITGGGVPALVLYYGNEKPQDLLLRVMRSLRNNAEAAANMNAG